MFFRALGEGLSQRVTGKEGRRGKNIMSIKQIRVTNAALCEHPGSRRLIAGPKVGAGVSPRRREDTARLAKVDKRRRKTGTRLKLRKKKERRRSRTTRTRSLRNPGGGNSWSGEGGEKNRKKDKGGKGRGRHKIVHSHP